DGGTTWTCKAGGAAATGCPSDPVLPNRFVSQIAVDPSDARHAYVVYSGFIASTPTRPGHIFETTNGGTTGVNVSGTNGAIGSLPDVPLNSIALDPWAAGTIYVGSDAGVYRTTTGGGSWTL